MRSGDSGGRGAGGVHNFVDDMELTTVRMTDLVFRMTNLLVAETLLWSSY